MLYIQRWAIHSHLFILCYLKRHLNNLWPIQLLQGVQFHASLLSLSLSTYFVHDISSRFFPGYHLFIFGWFVVALFDDLPEDHKHLTLHCDHYRSKISF
uniref:Uncharacterized protein MANES_14G085000 n=1 Tax=Rhizophora mucronata TaxID=61149 RepID=A0A2P2KYI4_RHIMU